METQTWLSCPYKFISVENITILSVSSDDFLHAFLEVAEQQMWKYSSYLKIKNKKIEEWKIKDKNKNYLTSLARVEGVKILGVRSIKKQECGISVGQPILIYVLVGGPVAGAIF